MTEQTLTPRYDHSCGICELIGQNNQYDFYVHREDYPGGTDEVFYRWGDGSLDESCFMMYDHEKQRIKEGNNLTAQRAVQFYESWLQQEEQQGQEQNERI